jgi:hypothetical protein
MKNYGVSLVPNKSAINENKETKKTKLLDRSYRV